jgi:hypothetical protein
MSEQDSAPRGGRLGWWPKLVLWGIVIAFGVVYLGSTKRQADEARTSAQRSDQTSAESAPGPGSPAATVPGTGAAAPAEAPAATVPGTSTTAPAEAPDATVPGTSTAAPAEEAAPAPVQAAESAAFARSLMSPETDPEPASDGIVAPAGSGEAAPAEVAAPGPAGVPDAVPDAGERVSADAEPPPPAPADALEAERRRILNEYQTMRRAAEGQMYQPWGPAMVPPPYGYPAGYGPGAYPGR